MKRRTGYYWVKISAVKWSIAFYSFGFDNWTICGDEKLLNDSDFIEINETRILNPYEL